jgi:hypothetical protein
MHTNRAKLFLLTWFLVLIGTGGALAQTSNTAHATIPFEFWVGSSRFPPGEYVITLLKTSSYLYIRSADGTAAQSVYTLPVDNVPADNDECTLVFEVRNGTHYLYGGRGPSGRLVVTAESPRRAPSGAERAEVPITFR